MTLAVVAAISIISYYTVSQLSNMAGSDSNDIITNQNHVVKAIQGEYNKLERTEKDVERLTKHIDDLENHLLIMNDLDTAFIKLLSIKNQCDKITNHISTIEIALYDLLKGKLSPSLVSTDNLSQTLNTLRNKVTNEGYTLGLDEVTDIIQSDCSFVSYEGGQIISPLHIPIYKIQTELSAYQYLNIPLTTSDNETAIIIQPQRPIIAINLQNELFIEVTNYELKYSCNRLKEKYFCERNAVMKRPQHKTCLTSLFRQNN